MNALSVGAYLMKRFFLMIKKSIQRLCAWSAEVLYGTGLDRSQIRLYSLSENLEERGSETLRKGQKSSPGATKPNTSNGFSDWNNGSGS